MEKNITGEKMLSHIDRIAGEKKPITADIFLTNYCNNRCPYCTYGRWELDTGAQAMRYEDFITYAKRLAVMGVQGFILTGGGEPTINPDFEKIAGWLTENNFQWGINTNFNKLVKVKPNYLKVSLDAYSNESYEQLRGVAAYETVRENIKAYAAWKKENSPGTSLGIQQLVKEPEDVKRFYDANKDLDVDYMVFRPVESTAGSYYRDERKKRDAEEIKKIVLDMAMDDERVTLNFKWGLLDRQEERCTASWAQMALNEKGEVMYCCHKPYQIIGDTWGNNCVKGKTYQFTLTKPVPAKGQLAGLYRAPDVSPSEWKVYSFESNTATDPIETVAMVEGTGGTALGTLSFKPTSPLNGLQSTAYGYNRWAQSAMRQWLNSEEANGKWWTPQHNFDRTPDQLKEKHGFLTGFDEEFTKRLKATKVSTWKNTLTDNGDTDGIEVTYDKVFLPSLEAMSINPQKAGEDDVWEYWKRASGMAEKMQQYKTYPQIRTFAIENHTSPQHVRLRSAIRGYSHLTWYVNSDGYVYNNYAYWAARCAPACWLC